MGLAPTGVQGQPHLFGQALAQDLSTLTPWQPSPPVHR